MCNKYSDDCRGCNKSDQDFANSGYANWSLRRAYRDDEIR